MLDDIKLANGVYLSLVDGDLIPFIYDKLGSSGRYARLRKNLPIWKQDESLHKVVALRACGESNGRVVDHINNNKLDNRRENLRYTDARTNGTKDRTGTSKYYRVSFHTKAQKWRVAFHVDQKVIETMGMFDTEEEAAIYSDIYALRFLADPVLLNFPDKKEHHLDHALSVKSVRPWQREIPTRVYYP